MTRTSWQLFLSFPQTCGYLPEQRSRLEFVDPAVTVDTAAYSALVHQGFRRSGQFFYRPACRDCHACIPYRVNVAEFRGNRSQQRNLKRNSQLTCELHPAFFSEEHFGLYSHYLAVRHPEGGMDNPTPEDYERFIRAPHIDTALLEIREGSKLKAVAITDVLRDGLSAVYTFYDPHATAMGLGTLAILRQIFTTRELGLPWLYLGYWIHACQRMRYKTDFKPGETLLNGRWRSLGEN